MERFVCYPCMQFFTVQITGVWSCGMFGCFVLELIFMLYFIHISISMNGKQGVSKVLHLTCCSTVQQFHRSASHEVCHAILEYIRHPPFCLSLTVINLEPL